MQKLKSDNIVSSANNFMHNFDTCGKSLTYTWNSNGALGHPTSNRANFWLL